MAFVDFEKKRGGITLSPPVAQGKLCKGLRCFA